jgi:RHS repeat-associated protein
LSITPNPAKPLEPIMMTATVTGSNPTGTVNFMSGLTLLGTSPVNAGVATLSTSFTDAGMRPVTAVYSGDPVNTSSHSIVVELNVNKVASTTSLSVTPSPARPGEPVTMTATVIGFNPTGVVSFMEGGYVIGGAVVNGGVATFNTTFPAAGSYVITALYGADTVNEASYSAPVVITINTGVAQAYFIHSDHLNTPRTITDTSGAVVWQWDNSDPFGNNAANENPGAAGQFNFPLRFPGQYFDKETNTHYNINRDYDPSTGRYIESDPIGLRGGINTYAYALSNPLKYIDPNGLEVQVCCREAQIAGGLVNHCWVQTDTKSAGMGTDPDVLSGQQYDGYGMPVFITDHSKDKATQCTPQKNVNEECVNNKLKIGEPIGRFMPPINHCQSFAYGVVNSCRTGPQTSPGQ